MNQVETVEEALRVRNVQQQEIIQDLVQISHNEGRGAARRSFHLKLTSTIIGYLIDRSNGITNPVIKQDPYGSFFVIVLVLIKNFARTEVERDAIIAKFLEKVMAAGLNSFHAALITQAMYKPEKLFDTHSTSEIFLG